MKQRSVKHISHFMQTKRMSQEHILSRHNTQWIQGVAALMVMVMHFVMATDNSPRLFKVFGSVGVAAFLFISGFGLNESYKSNGLGKYWRKRLLRVLLPCWIVFLFKLPFEERFELTSFLKNLTFYDSELWFVDYIIRWYIAYWVCRRFIPRYTTLALAALSVGSVFCQQLWSEQSFSFFMGYLVSRHYEKVCLWSRDKVMKITIAAVAYGLLFMVVKSLPPVRPYIGTLPFNFLLLNIKLPLAVFIIALPHLLPWVKRMRPISWCGRASYEIYMVHYYFMPYITGAASVLGYSAVTFVITAVFNKLNVRLKERGRLLMTLATIIFVGVNYMLLTKYSMRLTPRFGCITITYALLLTLVCLWFSRKSVADRWAKPLFYALSAVFAVLMLVVQYHFDPMQIQVDRWSAIANPLTALFNGDFPYLANTHLGGNASPFPVWLTLHIPFWALGNVGLSSIVAALLFLLSVKLLYGYGSALKATVLLGLSVCLWYEVAVRSDLIANFLLLAAFMNVLQSRGVSFGRHPYALSVIAGLWLSTRLSVAFPLFILFFVPWLKLSVKKKVAAVALVIITFCLTFLPLVVWDAHSLFFFENNPFSLQSRQGRSIDFIVLVALAFVIAVKGNGRFSRQQFFSALMLVLTPVIAYGHNMIVYQNWTEIFNSAYDITYLNAALPFLITVLVEKMNEKEL